MGTRKRTVTLEELRLREVALNSTLAKMGHDMRVKAVEVRKSNIFKPGFRISVPGAHLQMTYYPTPEDMTAPDLKLLDEMAKRYSEGLIEMPKEDADIDRESFIAHLMPRVMSADNADWLKEAGRPCKAVLDMVMTLQSSLEANSLTRKGEIASLQVTDELLERNNLTAEEAFAIAMRNAERVAEITPMRQVIEELLGGELPEEEDAPKMFIASNDQRTNGAPVMFCKKVQSELLEIFGRESVYILPSSVHEVIAISASYMQIDELKQMVSEINRSTVEPEDRLTDEVYTLTGTPEAPVLGMHTSLGVPGQTTFLVAHC